MEFTKEELELLEDCLQSRLVIAFPEEFVKVRALQRKIETERLEKF